MKSRNILILGIFMVILLVAGYFFVSGHPRYSFFRLGQAIKTHDIELFNIYADVDAIVDEWVQWSSEEAKLELKEQAKTPDNPISEGFVELLLPSMRAKLKEEFKQKIIETIENTQKSAQISGLPIINIALLPIHNIAIEKGTATLEILHPSSGEKIIFKLRHMPQRYWRLVSIHIPALMKRGPKKTSLKTYSGIAAKIPKATALESTIPSLPRRETNSLQLDLKKIPDSPSAREEVINKTIAYTEYYQMVREKIRKNITSENKKKNKGSCKVKLIILSDGQLKDLKIIDENNTFRRQTLELTIKAINEASPFPPFPAELNSPELEFIIPISFETA